MTALPFTTVPASDPSTKLISVAVEVILEPSICNFLALISPAEP